MLANLPYGRKGQVKHYRAIATAICDCSDNKSIRGKQILVKYDSGEIGCCDVK